MEQNIVLAFGMGASILRGQFFDNFDPLPLVANRGIFGNPSLLTYPSPVAFRELLADPPLPLTGYVVSGCPND